jgi:hypothetical protein
MNRQQSGNDAEICAETWEPIHLRSTGGLGNLIARSRQRLMPIFSFHAASQEGNDICYSMPQWLLSA